MKKPKIEQKIKPTPKHLMPTGTELSPEMKVHREKSRAAMKQLIKERKKEEEVDKYILEQRRKAS